MSRAAQLLDDAVRQLVGGMRRGRSAPDTALAEVLQEVVRTVADGGTCPDLRPLASPTARDFLAGIRSTILSGRLDGDEMAPADALAAAAAVDVVARAVDVELQLSTSVTADGGSASAAILEVAHDMRSPLNAILLLMQADGATGQVDGEQARRRALVYDAAAALSALVDDLVDAARPANRRLPAAPVAFSVRALLASVRDIVAPLAEQKQLALRVRTTMPDRHLGHPVQLRRILLNLATNALKYTQRGAVVLRAHSDGDGRAEFTVSDTGSGIPPHLLPLLFSPFRPHDYSLRQRTFSRAGLGLALCRHLADAMGGELLVESVPGRGTTFTLAVPLPACEAALHPVVSCTPREVPLFIEPAPR